MASLSSPLVLPLPSRARFEPFYRNNKVVCNASNNSNKFDRREALIGFGGLYGASTFSPELPFAIAAPVQTPNPSKCGTPTDLPPGVVTPPDCCPTPTDNIADYIFPPRPRKLRIRKAAQSLDKTYIEKYKRAVEIMRGLPDDDPLSFKQQADIHCAYCNGSYQQLGFPIELQVHFSWLFFPFHRYYLYFHERILGSLIGDKDFALPFWNYDAPDGMEIPKIYTDRTSSLYDPLRDGNHQPPTLVDLDYNTVEPTIDRERQIRSNLGLMYRQVVSGARTPLLFFGRPYQKGDKPSPGMGTVENQPHNPVHLWAGDPNEPNREDMGTFYAAGRDPIFYAHHSNIDRFWYIWKTLGGKRKDLQYKDWLNASFIFYNENRKAVRVYVKDCLDTKNLGYVYDNVKIPWIKARPTPRKTLKSKKVVANNNKDVPFRFGGIGAALAEPTSIRVEKPGRAEFPLSLNKIVSTEVKRPKKSRSKQEKDDEEEILVIDGIEFDANKAIKFDVFINDEDDREIRADNTEFAGSFVNVPHMPNSGMNISTCLRLGITELLEDLDADDDDTVVVTLVPKFGDEPVIIGDIKIEFET